MELKGILIINILFTMYQSTQEKVSEEVSKGDILKNENNEIIYTHIQKEEIEKEIMNYNLNHFKQAHQLIVYRGKIYNKLKQNDVRDKILSRRLTREECDNEDVFEFLNLLKMSRNK